MQTERFEMRLDRGTLERLDRWRASQPELPSRAEAVRRLVHAGLTVSTDEEVRPSLSEKLILSMLCDLSRDRDDKERIDPDFVEEAIFSGHYWAFNWKYPHIFGGHPDSPELVREVVEILDMWDVMEHHYEQLGEPDKNRVALGGRGQLPTRGSHGSGRAPFGHPAPQMMVSLLNGTHCARLAPRGGDRCCVGARSGPMSCGPASFAGRAICATAVPLRIGIGSTPGSCR